MGEQIAEHSGESDLEYISGALCCSSEYISTLHLYSGIAVRGHCKQSAENKSYPEHIYTLHLHIGIANVNVNVVQRANHIQNTLAAPAECISRSSAGIHRDPNE